MDLIPNIYQAYRLQKAIEGKEKENFIFDLEDIKKRHQLYTKSELLKNTRTAYSLGTSIGHPYSFETTDLKDDSGYIITASTQESLVDEINKNGTYHFPEGTYGTNINIINQPNLSKFLKEEPEKSFEDKGIRYTFIKKEKKDLGKSTFLEKSALFN